MTRPTIVLALTLLLAAAACGTDDGATVTTIDDEGGSASGSASGSATGSASGSASGSATGSASGSASGSATGTGELPCSPVNPELEAEAQEAVVIEALDYAFDPAQVEAPAGVTTFTLENVGEENHELAFLPGGGEVPFTEDGAPDEAALEEAGAFELEAFSPGQSCNATYDLEPGEYTLFCIIETDEGVTHYELGMQGTLIVS